MHPWDETVEKGGQFSWTGRLTSKRPERRFNREFKLAAPQVAIEPAIRIAEECLRPAVAAPGHVTRQAGDDHEDRTTAQPVAEAADSQRTVSSIRGPIQLPKPRAAGVGLLSLTGLYSATFRPSAHSS